MDAQSIVRSIASVESIYTGNLRATEWRSLLAVWREEKGAVGNSGQLRSLLSENTAVVHVDGSKAAVRIAVFSWKHKSSFLF